MIKGISKAVPFLCVIILNISHWALIALAIELRYN